MIDEFPENYYHEVNGEIHPAGYTNYARTLVINANDPDDQGETYKTDYFKFFNRHRQVLEGKIVLDLGCAFGFFVDDARSFGADAHGIDNSEYAINQASTFCGLFDARHYLPMLEDGCVDTITGFRFLPCLTDEEIAALLPHIQRVAANRIFVVDNLESYPPGAAANLQDYYNIKPLSEWQSLMTGCTIESISGWGCK